MIDTIKKYFDVFLNLGVAKGDDNETMRKKRLYIPMATAGVLIGLLIFFVESYFDFYPQAYQPFVLSISFLIILVYFILSKNLDNVSILFADIVGFTKISETLTPENLVEILNRIFIEFDSITERNGLEKIKTIGDAYMAAAGIPEIHSEHAIACVKSALEMNQFIKNDPFLQKIQLELRIGIHSGSECQRQGIG
ncbi:adenylate/guanylate cyclase domain-containing protein [Leptospira sp. GIMC2001]|uniref:adenylate/guanylate cyclase domain-containing protein n=1 Tax=Leptospira sp. GIMC2001 TaxID=1513297 RepID=UPI00234AB65F|nr:adenylate/guanylate cyclase domain-containing protein [Leptospira sp. GIMC2001]WCL50889.1 adenylate/guanylate cyclase domain-containing protein [Leptospira sp. GIMC2001]